MTKTELSAMLKSICSNVYEGTAPATAQNTFPKITYWPYVFEDVVASGEEYEEKWTYQVSCYLTTPPEASLLPALRTELRARKLYPVIYSEYVEEDKVFHTYFALEVMV